MTDQTLAREILYNVVVNAADQYSLWPAADDVPAGWKIVSEVPAAKSECLAEIERAWVDMLPLARRKSAAEPGIGPAR